MADNSGTNGKFINPKASSVPQTEIVGIREEKSKKGGLSYGILCF